MKSEAMWFGSKQNRTDTFWVVMQDLLGRYARRSLCKRRLKILGGFVVIVSLCDKCASQVEENWTEKLKKQLQYGWDRILIVT